MMWLLAIVVIVVGIGFAYAQTEIFQTNDLTLVIVILGSIFGAIVRNVFGYLDEKKDNEQQQYKPSELIKTLVYSILIGVVSASNFTTLLQVDISGSLTKQIVLLLIVIAYTAGINSLGKHLTMLARSKQV